MKKVLEGEKMEFYCNYCDLPIIIKLNEIRNKNDLICPFCKKKLVYKRWWEN